MMKKLLALVLVLGIASSASAVSSIASDVLSIDWTLGEVATITISSDNADNYGGWLGIDGGPGDVGVMTILAAAGPQASAVASPQWYKFAALSTDPADPVLAGEQFTVPVMGAGDVDGTIIVSLYDFAGTGLIQSVEIASVPEPMTMGLLGLGGLFLRRRK
jgi:hypothetical protein